MSVNVDLLIATLEHIQETPEEWYQGAWAYRNPCGTSFCFAGAAVVLAGDTLVFSDGGRFAVGSLCRRPAGSMTRIAHRATELLGLSRDQALLLFCSDNSLERLEDLVFEFATEAQAG